MKTQIKIKDIICAIEEIAPFYWQANYDNAGLIIGNKENICSGVYICLDVFADTVRQAMEKHCNLIISHHPFIFNGIKKLVYGSETEEILSLALKHNIAIYSTHTNMDSASTGVNFTLAQKLKLKNLSPLDNSKYPENKNYLGEGACGFLKKKIAAKDYLEIIKKELNLPFIKFIGNEIKNIKKVGFCGGSGSFLIEKAIKNNCDIFLTGDLKYHDFLTFEKHIIVADIGHFESEIFIKQRIFDIISEKICNFAALYISQETNRIKFL